MGHAGTEAIALGGEISSEKNAKTSSGIPSTGDISEVKTRGKWNPEMSGKTQILKGEEITGEDDAANLPKGSYVQEGEALQQWISFRTGKESIIEAGNGWTWQCRKSAFRGCKALGW